MMFEQKFKAIFFDWDNTLVDTWPILLKASDMVLQHFGLPIATLDEVKVYGGPFLQDSFLT